MLQRRLSMQDPDFDIDTYCDKEKNLRNAIRSTLDPIKKEKNYKKLRAHLGILELPDK